MTRILVALLLCVALPAFAIDVVNMPNPSNYVPALGSQAVHQAGSVQYYTSTGDKQVTTGASALLWVANATGTTITVTFFDDGDGTCNSNQKTGVFTLVNSAPPLQLTGKYANGVCMTVAGTSPTVSVGTYP